MPEFGRRCLDRSYLHQENQNYLIIGTMKRSAENNSELYHAVLNIEAEKEEPQLQNKRGK